MVIHILQNLLIGDVISVTYIWLEVNLTLTSQVKLVLIPHKVISVLHHTFSSFILIDPRAQIERRLIERTIIDVFIIETSF
jgi:hypothetical protein